MPPEAARRERHAHRAHVGAHAGVEAHARTARAGERLVHPLGPHTRGDVTPERLSEARPQRDVVRRQRAGGVVRRVAALDVSLAMEQRLQSPARGHVAHAAAAREPVLRRPAGQRRVGERERERVDSPERSHVPRCGREVVAARERRTAHRQHRRARADREERAGGGARGLVRGAHRRRQRERHDHAPRERDAAHGVLSMR
jgi:hypothetical protein